VVAVSNSKGTLHRPDGLDVEAVVAHEAANGTIYGLAGTEQLDREAVLGLPADVLIPAALGDALTAANVDEVACRTVIEAANQPVTPWADAALNERGVTVVPDILANAGGVLTSYFEWVQNLQELRWEEADVNQRLEGRMAATYDAVRALATQRDVSLREAAYALGVSRVAEASTLRGVI
jgi:glutamate dehydrogenase (NAD(P)+)